MPHRGMIKCKHQFERYLTERKEHIMLSWALFFFLIAILAAVFGFGGIAGAASGIAQLLFFAFLVLAVVVLLTGRGRSSLV